MEVQDLQYFVFAYAIEGVKGSPCHRVYAKAVFLDLK